MNQKTIRDPVALEGVGLQTGSRVKLVLKGAPADSGINFLRVDLPDRNIIHIGQAGLPGCGCCHKDRRTTLTAGSAEIQTAEHLLAALSGLGINNIIVEADRAELPGLDGSAIGYVEALERARIVEQDAPAKELVVKDAVYRAGKDALLAAFPHDGFKVSYFLSYPVKSMREQFFSLEITPESFKRELAPARTFCMKREAWFLRMLGFGRGANTENTLIMGNKGPLNNSLRFPNEPVRHKILDLVGDLSLVGMPLKAHIVAVKSGHSLNAELVRKLKDI